MSRHRLIRVARRRHRRQRRVLGLAAERASGELRPEEMQGPQWADCHRQTLSGVLDPLPSPGPPFRNVTAPGSAESSYYTWVDQFNALGLGKNVPIATGNLNDALLPLVDGKFVTLRVPYVIGYFAKGVDGRIDDPTRAGGQEWWTADSTRTMFHLETSKGTLPKVVRFQRGPDPLAN
jgi:hypothetical protein